MSGVDQDFLRNLKEKVNIVEVAESYFSLEKRGGSYWACCPFHHEKTPSFAINEAGQYYHCFGCGESGDVIKFVCEMESADFIDGVKMLAERAHIPMPAYENDNGKTAELKRKKDAVLKILNETAHFYLRNLNSGNADAHIEYILRRKIPSTVVRAFGLGASLNYDDLPRYLISAGFSAQDIVDSGVVNEVNGKLTDAQGGRLIFPIINSYGEVIAFGGRLLKKTNFAKYVNTRDTIVFTKRKNLYNINLLKKLKREQTIKEVIMVEGYMDTISLYQAGFRNVVASMGTSLTQDQARLIKRYTDTVLISYDGDAAGQKANIRGLDILKDEGLNVRVVPLPEGLDPDDVIKQLGNQAYGNCLEGALPLIDYKLDVLGKGYDLTKTEDKRRYVSEALKVISTADSNAEKEELLKKLRTKSGISYESLKRDLEQNPAEARAKAPEQPKKREDNADAIVLASRFVISGFLFGADYARDVDISSVEFADPVHEIIAKYIRSKQLMEEPVQLSELFEFFDENTREYEELSHILDYSEGGGFSAEVSEKYFNDCLLKLKINAVDRQIRECTQAMDACDDLAQRANLGAKIVELTRQKQKIRNGVKL